MTVSFSSSSDGLRYKEYKQGSREIEAQPLLTRAPIVSSVGIRSTPLLQCAYAGREWIPQRKYTYHVLGYLKVCTITRLTDMPVETCCDKAKALSARGLRRLAKRSYGRPPFLCNGDRKQWVKVVSSIEPEIGERGVVTWGHRGESVRSIRSVEGHIG